MVSWKYVYISCLLLMFFATLFFIPSEKTGFATQVGSTPRAIVGFVFTFIVMGVLIVLGMKRGASSQQLLSAWQDNPEKVVVTIANETKPGNYVEQQEIGKIIDAVIKKYKVPIKQKPALMSYLNNLYQTRQQEGRRLNPYEVVQACVHYVWNYYGRRQTTQNKNRGDFWQH